VKGWDAQVSQRRMRPVAEGRALRMLAPAPGDRFSLRDFGPDRPETGALVRPVTERLAL